MSSAATKPDTAQIAFSHRREMFFNSPMPSMIMLLPRETIKATNPQASAPATADESPTR